MNILPAAIERARARGGLVVAQLNPRMPHTLGDAEIAVNAVDLAIEVDEPLTSPPSRAGSETTTTIAGNVASLVADGSTLQVGIGELPDAVLHALTARHGLAVWSEVISDGVLGLERSGALDAERVITTSFLFGTSELYEWVDANPRVRVMRTETVNDPTTIAAHHSMCSINSALQVDLYAQANASYVHGRIYSGFGGQPDFVVGALHSVGGQAVIALPSWHAKSDTSTIVGRLDTPVTSFQHSSVVTEQGCAFVFGRSQRAQARLLTENAAHPDAREHLRAERGTHRRAVGRGPRRAAPVRRASAGRRARHVRRQPADGGTQRGAGVAGPRVPGTGVYLVGTDMGAVHQMGDAFHAGAREGVADEGDLARTGLAEARGHRQDRAIVLGDPPTAVVEALDVRQVPVLVEDARELAHLLVERQVGQARLRIVQAALAPLLEEPRHLVARRSSQVAQQLRREVAVALGEQHLRGGGQLVEVRRSTAAVAVDAVGHEAVLGQAHQLLADGGHRDTQLLGEVVRVQSSGALHGEQDGPPRGGHGRQRRLDGARLRIARRGRARAVAHGSTRWTSPNSCHR